MIEVSGIGQNFLNQDYSISLEYQTLFDLSLESSGSIEAIFELAQANGFSITDAPDIGTKIKWADVVDEAVWRYYLKHHVRSVTGILQQDGIDYMGIEFDFIVT